MRSSTTSLRLQRQRVQSASLSLMCVSAGAVLTGACLLSLAAQTETGISWSQSPLIIACLLCAFCFSMAGGASAFLGPKNRHTAINSFVLILSACGLLGQIALALWA